MKKALGAAAVLASLSLAPVASAATLDLGFNGAFTISSGLTGPGGVTTPVQLSGTTTTSDFSDGSFTISDFKLTSGLGNYNLSSGTATFAGSTLNLFEGANTFLGSFALSGLSVGSNTASAFGTLIGGSQGFTLPDGNLIGIQAGSGMFSATLAPTGAVPEPASWAMMILGMGAVGFALRRGARRSEARFNAKIKLIEAGAIT